MAIRESVESITGIERSRRASWRQPRLRGPHRVGYRHGSILTADKPVAKPNYAFEKRQRELEKKRKKEEKSQRKTTGPGTHDDAAPGPADGAPPPPAQP